MIHDHIFTGVCSASEPNGNHAMCTIESEVKLRGLSPGDAKWSWNDSQTELGTLKRFLSVFIQRWATKHTNDQHTIRKVSLPTTRCPASAAQSIVLTDLVSMGRNP